MAVFELPDAFNICGVNLTRGDYSILLKEGNNIDKNLLEKETDIIVASYPRTGTTWTIQIVSLLRAGEEHYDTVSKVGLLDRSDYIEFYRLQEPLVDPIEKIKDFPRPRIVKTHLPYHFVNKWVERDGVKTIVTIRNPKDTLVSLFHFYLTYKEYKFSGTWDDFFNHVKAEKTLYGSQVDWCESWWKNKDRENILFLKYEDMLEDLPKEMKRIIEFLELNVSNRLFNKVLHDSAMKEMQNNPVTNFSDFEDFDKTKNFIRKGGVGKWKDYFTEEQNEWFDARCKERLDKTGMDISYE